MDRVQIYWNTRAAKLRLPQQTTRKARVKHNDPDGGEQGTKNAEDHERLVQVIIFRNKEKDCSLLVQGLAGDHEALSRRLL
eukprot:3941538-Rhodomonas_salina.3